MLFKNRPDLLSHLVVGPFCAAAGGVVHSLAHITFAPQWAAALAALLIATAGKELVWDRLLKKGTPAWDDFLYGLGSGGVVVLAMALGSN